MKKYFFSFCLIFLCFGMEAQPVAFPSTYIWQGNIGGKKPFEMQIDIINVESALQGNCYELKGYCTFEGSWERWPLKGNACPGKGEMLINLFDGAKMIQSFKLWDTGSQQRKADGKWTNGKDKADFSIEEVTLKGISEAYQTGFCELVNWRNPAAKKDSMLEPLWKKINIAPYERLGKGYRLNETTLEMVETFGATYINFVDSLRLPDSTWQITQLSYRLLGQAVLPTVLEIQQQSKGWKQQNIVRLWQYRTPNWVEITQESFPEDLLNEGKLLQQTATEAFFDSSDAIVFYSNNLSKTIVLRWKQNLWRRE